MADEVRLSGPTLRVLKTLLENAEVGKSGAELSQGASVGSGTLYPLLSRLEKAGWCRSEWENGEPPELGRPRRRYYWLTVKGKSSAMSAFREFQMPSGEPKWAF